MTDNEKKLEQMMLEGLRNGIDSRELADKSITKAKELGVSTFRVLVIAAGALGKKIEEDRKNERK